MSVFSSWDYNAKATFWRPTLDAFAQPSSYERVVRYCTFTAGGRQAVDDMGEQFVPRTVIFLESAVASAPKAGDYFVVGDISGDTPPAAAETVRSVRQIDTVTFNEGLPDWEVTTG